VHACTLEREQERSLLGRADGWRHDDVHGTSLSARTISRVQRVDDRLRPLWDFDDLDGSERRLRTQLDAEASDDGRAEVLTQLARVAGLRGDFGAADELLDDAGRLAGEDALARIRIDLERGRVRRSSGDPDAARPLFESSYALALEDSQHFIAADAAHMVALVAPDRAAVVDWTSRGIELAQTHETASYWAGPLLNNLGWEYYEAGDVELALDAFERALLARERDPANGDGLALARYAVGKALRALGRSDDAVPLLELAVEWAEGAGAPDGWFHEELAEEYAALGRRDDARTHARLAIPLLETADPSFGRDAERTARLHGLTDE
jgi:tetratricopeptide (TPR) repeat protein